MRYLKTFESHSSKDILIVVDVQKSELLELQESIRKYTEDSDIPFTILMDAQMNCPWVRAIVSNINEMDQMSFDEYMKIENRERKIKELGL